MIRITAMDAIHIMQMIEAILRNIATFHAHPLDIVAWKTKGAFQFSHPISPHRRIFHRTPICDPYEVHKSLRCSGQKSIYFSRAK